MIKQKNLLKKVMFGGAIAVWAGVVSFSAQDLYRAPIQNVAQPKSSPGIVTRKARKSTATVQRVQPKIITKTVTQKVNTSDLVVTTKPGATVLLEPLNPRARSVPSQTADEQGIVVFEDLKTTRFKVTASLNGYETVEKDEIEVPAQETVGINLDLEPIKSTLTIQTNLKEGEVRYARANLIRRTAEGLLTEETGGYCIVPIKNNVAVIEKLDRSYYNIDIRPGFNEIAYQPLKTAVNVSSEDQSYEIKLDPKISKGEFSSAWTSGDWVLPQGWRLDRGMKTGGLPGIALPRNELYRYYTDFEMKSNVKLLDGSTVGFVVRSDEQAKNYYLVEISGANAAEPNVVKGFVVKNGRRQQIFSNPLPKPGAIARQKSFRVIIRGENAENAQKPNVLKLFIEDTEMAEVFELGNIEDRDKNFLKGAIGVESSGNSNFEVGYFIVCYRSCP